LDEVGVGETARGGLAGWVREIEAFLEHPVAAPVRRIWHRANGASLEISPRSIGLPRWPRDRTPLRVLHLSDLHTTAEVDTGQWLRRLTAARFDLVAVTGDLIQDDTGIVPSTRFLAALRRRARLGVYATLGNHDYLAYSTARLPDGRAVQRRALNDVAALRHALIDSGVRLLENEAISLSGAGERPVWVAGVSDPYTGHDDMERALAEVPQDAVVLMLAHSPDQLPAAAAYGVDLLLGGHTHGGQVCIPWVGPLRTATLGPVRLASGYAEYRQTRCYISRGLGTAGLPIRLLCRPEAAVLSLSAPAGSAHASSGSRNRAEIVAHAPAAVAIVAG
jgi:predicted MPP superfamily phosphohydrolase